MEGQSWSGGMSSNWLLPTLSECSWWSQLYLNPGLFSNAAPCNEAGEMEILSIFLNVSHLSPSIPPEVSLLDSFAVLQVEHALSGLNGTNQMTEFLPRQAFRLQNLSYLAVAGNNLQGD